MQVSVAIPCEASCKEVLYRIGVYYKVNLGTKPRNVKGDRATTHDKRHSDRRISSGDTTGAESRHSPVPAADGKHSGCGIARETLVEPDGIDDRRNPLQVRQRRFATLAFLMLVYFDAGCALAVNFLPGRSSRFRFVRARQLFQR